MIENSHIIEWLVKYGYLPRAEAQWTSLALRDDIVRDSVRKLQDFARLHPLNDMVRAHHGRDLIADGDVGPATRELIGLPRCDVPDFGPSAMPAPGGTGSWPAPCQKSGVKVFVDLTNCPYRDEWPGIWADVAEAYRLAGLKYVLVNSLAECNIHVYFRSFFGSTIGLSEFNGRSCGDRVFCSLSNSYRGENRGLLKHEIGHCDNLGHTSGGTMNPWIMKEPDPHARWLTTDPSWPRLVAFHDGVPVGTGPEPTPTPTPIPIPVPQPEPPRRPFLEWLRKLFNW